MFSFRNKKKLSLTYPEYPLLSGALIHGPVILYHAGLVSCIQSRDTHPSKFPKGMRHMRDIDADSVLIKPVRCFISIR